MPCVRPHTTIVRFYTFKHLNSIKEIIGNADKVLGIGKPWPGRVYLLVDCLLAGPWQRENRKSLSLQEAAI